MRTTFLRLIFLMVILALISCATDSGVVQVGKDTFFITKQAASGFSGMGDLKAEALQEAYDKCSKTGESVKIVKSEESQPPYIFGNFPRIELTFNCVPDTNTSI